ncbi:MAG: cell division protein FtsX [Rhodospirillales bacterium]
MFDSRTDLPLDRDGLTRFLPWLIAFMVYLAVLALAGMLALVQVAGRWDKGISGSYTIQVPASLGNEETERRAGLILDILKPNRAIHEARIVPRAEALSLVEPWLGNLPAEDLPLPVLIDVELADGAELDVDRLARAIAEIVPEAELDDHRVWLDRLLAFIGSAVLLAAAILSLIGAATVGTVVFATRSGLTVHEEAIQVLHLIGAQDSYVARQFAGHAWKLGLLGGLIGLVLALPTVLALQFLIGRLETGLMPDVSFAWWEWALLAAPALVAGLVARATARVTVMRNLARMP